MNEWNAQDIKKLREKMDLSQDELADLLGCRQQTISEWETGQYLPGNAYSRLLNNLRASQTTYVRQSSYSETRIPQARSAAASKPEPMELNFAEPVSEKSDFDSFID